MSAFLWLAASASVVCRGHEGPVFGVAFVPDGSAVVSGSYDGTLRVWDAASGRERARARVECGVNDIAVRPCAEGRVLVYAGCDDGVVRAFVWEEARGEIAPAADLPGLHRGFAMRVAVESGADGVVRIASGGVDGRVILRVFRPEGEPEVTEWLPEPGGYVLGVDLAGDEVAVAAWDRRLRVYGTGVWTHRLDSEPNDVAFVAGGGALVAVTMDGALVRVAREGGETAWDRIEAHDGPAWTLAVAPDGGLIATAGADGRVRVWDAATGARRDEIVRHEGDVYGLAISPDGTRLASAGRDRTVRIHARAAP